MITDQELKLRAELNAQGYWKIPKNLDCSQFDFNWRPDPWDRPYIHQFGTQWQKTGGPRFIVPNNEGVKYQNFQKAIKLPDTNDRGWRPMIANIEFDYSWHPDETEPPFIYVFGNQWHPAEVMPTMMYRVKGATQKKYVNDTTAMLKETHDLAWKALTKINAFSFDFTWVPNPYEPPFNYAFGTKYHSAEEMPVLLYQTENSIATKFINDIKVDISIAHITYEDSIYDAVMNARVPNEYIYVAKNHSSDVEKHLYTEKPTVHLFQDSAIVPRIAKPHFHDKLHDYEHVQKHHEVYVGLLDVIFFSNGEECAEANFEHLTKVVAKTGNRVVRIDGIKGRVASQHAAANASNTPWYFLVNAKLRVNENFDFTWQPDIFKSRRHYIFTALNNLNRLEYGHQAMVANNKKLTLATEGKGLDFTMESTTEVLRINSGTAVFNASPWDTWRTAFRECIKLKHANDHESRFRLNVWKTIARGEFGEYSLKGAKDAIEYYESVNGEFDKLKLSYDWEWLWEYFNSNK